MNRTILTDKERFDLEALCLDLAECSDVMPKTLKQHQDEIRNSCLDMVYGFQKLLAKRLEQNDSNSMGEKKKILFISNKGDLGVHKLDENGNCNTCRKLELRLLMYGFPTTTSNEADYYGKSFKSRDLKSISGFMSKNEVNELVGRAFDMGYRAGIDMPEENVEVEYQRRKVASLQKLGWQIDLADK